MTSGQEEIVITKIQIYTVLPQKFGVSETKGASHHTLFFARASFRPFLGQKDSCQKTCDETTFWQASFCPFFRPSFCPFYLIKPDPHRHVRVRRRDPRQAAPLSHYHSHPFVSTLDNVIVMVRLGEFHNILASRCKRAQFVYCQQDIESLLEKPKDKIKNKRRARKRPKAVSK